METSREALIEKLVVSLHLNVPERQMLEPKRISLAEVAAAVRRLFQRHSVFPPAAKIWKTGETVFEGPFLIGRTDGKIDMRWQRSHPIRPKELAEHSRTEYGSLDEAISKFIEAAWGEDIDGITLTRE